MTVGNRSVGPVHSVKAAWGLFCCLLAILCCPAAIMAQEIHGQQDSSVHAAGPSPTISHSAGRSIEIWGASAEKARLRTRYGTKKERSLHITSFRIVKHVLEQGFGTISLTNDIIPIVIATRTPHYRDTSFRRMERVTDNQGISKDVPVDVDSLIYMARTIYGFGWAPLGIRYTTPKTFGMNGTIGFSAGALYFNRRMPDPRETRFNFTLDGYALVSIPVPLFSGQRIQGGFHYNHISNAHSGRSNPGMNTPMWTVGWSLNR